ncbi:MAG: hypothetical protein Q7U57_03765 [Methylovulum sp.]|nr:hypothetical protein [Methylovulum sp.]
MLNKKSIIIPVVQSPNALAKIGLNTNIVKSIAMSAAGGRADSLSIDPYGTPGTLSYIHGVRAKRLQLLPKGWRENRLGNVESTVNDELGIQLCFQNVDLACNPDGFPRAISAKGPVSRNLINSGQTDLFDTSHGLKKDNFGSFPAVWLICVSVDDQLSVKAEVSRPMWFEGNQFEGFHERIFVVDESFTPEPRSNRSDDDDDSDFEVYVSKK